MLVSATLFDFVPQVYEIFYFTAFVAGVLTGRL